MKKNNMKLLSMLPPELQDLKIEERHKVLLTSRKIGNDVWIILLTDMPGQRPTAWRMTAAEFYKIYPKHGTRERYIRENRPPTFQSGENERQLKMPSLLF